MTSQDLIFPYLPRPVPMISPGVEIMHVGKLAKSKQIKAKNKNAPDNSKYNNMQRHLNKKLPPKEPPKEPGAEHEIDLFV